MSDDGGPAFPRHEVDTKENEKVEVHRYYHGMTLRDYFAGQAIARCIEVMAQFVMSAEDFVPNEVGLSEVVQRGVEMTYHVADAMLAERAK